MYPPFPSNCPPYYPPGYPSYPPQQLSGLTTPAIYGCKLEMTVAPSTVFLIRDILPVHLGVFFNAITNLEVISGSYLAANNTSTLATGITSNPNFIILITDSPTNLTVMAGSNTIAMQNPVNKLYFNAMVANTTYGISSIVLDGTTAAPVPQSQTVAVNYTLLYGTGIVN